MATYVLVLNLLLDMTMPPCALVNNPDGLLTVGSACSGWCSEIFSLKQMKVPHTPVFCFSESFVAPLCIQALHSKPLLHASTRVLSTHAAL